MPTIQEILDNDLGLGSEQSQEKVASQSELDHSTDSEIEKLAAEVGLFGSQPEESSSTSKEQLTGHSKEASMSLENIYTDLFPGDADVISGSQEKVAAADTQGLSKEAAAQEERIGELSYDYFQTFVGSHLNKMAEELTGDATISTKSVDDSQPGQTMANNEPNNSDKPVNTTPVITDHVKAEEKAPYVSGDEHQKQPPAAASHSELKEAAVRKHLLMAELQA